MTAYEPGATDVRDGPPDRRPLWIAIGLLLVPMVVSAGVLLIRVGSSFHALSDNGQNELHTRDVGRHLVTLGPYSRDGWNHLGPAMYYLLAVPYRLTGSNSVGMYVGALAINAVALAGILVIAWRRGGLPVLLFTALGLAYVAHTLGADFLRDPWNPYMTVLPFGLLVFLTWELSAGRPWALPPAAGVASFLVQTHVGYVPLAVPLLLGGAAWLVVATRRSGLHGDGAPLDVRRVLNAAMVAGVVLVVMWVPPVIGVLMHTPGNLGTALRFFLHPKGDPHTVLDGYRVVAEQFATRPEWITGAHTPGAFTGEPDFLFHTPVPWLILPVVAAVAVLWRRRNYEAVRLAAIVVIALGLGVLAVSRTIGPVYAYRLRWTWLLAMMAAVLVVWAVWVLGSAASRVRLRPWLLVAIGAGLAVLTVANTVSAARTSTPDKPESTRLARLVPSLVRALPKRDGVVVVSSTSFGSSTYSGGIILWLERIGIPVREANSPDAAQGAGQRRVYHGGPIRAAVTVGDDASYDRLAGDPKQKLVAYQGTRSPSERVAILARLDALAAQHRSGALSVRDLYILSVPLARELGRSVGVFVLRT
jgi:hypothetical protein